jgi:hypothetical protein
MAIAEQCDQQPIDQRLLPQNLPTDAAPERLKVGLNQVFGGITTQGGAFEIVHGD